jgi:translation initiation factor 5A
MSHTHPEEAHHVKKGGFLMLKGHPCKIVDVKTSKTGKHGHAKCNITGVGVLNERKFNEVHPGHIVLAAFDKVQCNYDVTDINEEDGVIDCIDEDGTEAQFTLKLDSEVDQVKKCHTELLAKFKEFAEKGDGYCVVTTTTAPVGEGDKCELQSEILEWSEGKE